MIHPTALEYSFRVHELIATDALGFGLYKAKQAPFHGDWGYLLRFVDGRIQSWTRLHLSKSAHALATPKEAPGGAWYRVEDGREIDAPRAGWGSY